MHDFEPGWDTYKEVPGYVLESDLTFDDVKVADYDAVLCIGGRAPEYLRNDPRVLAILREFDAARQMDLRHLPWRPARCRRRAPQGQTVTCYEHVRLEAEAAGGRYVTADSVAMDGWSRHPHGRSTRRSTAKCSPASSSPSPSESVGVDRTAPQGRTEERPLFRPHDQRHANGGVRPQRRGDRGGARRRRPRDRRPSDRPRRPC